MFNTHFSYLSFSSNIETKRISVNLNWFSRFSLNTKVVFAISMEATSCNSFTSSQGIRMGSYFRNPRIDLVKFRVFSARD